MFDVSWTDPRRETVGQRKNRKDQQTNGRSRASSVRSSNSNESQVQNPTSLLNLLGGNNSATKKGIIRTGSHPKLSSIRLEEKPTKASRRVSSYTVASDALTPESSQLNRASSHNYFPEEPFPEEPCHSDHEQSSSSDGDVSESVFSGWTGRSANTESTWSSVIESSASQGKSMQSVSGSSFVTQFTEVTVSPRDSVKADEQIATLVSISAASTTPIEIRETQRQGSNSSSTFEFPMPNAAQSPESVVLPPSPILGRADSQRIACPIISPSRQFGSRKLVDAWDFPNEVHETLSISPPTMLGPPLVPLRSYRRKRPPLELSHWQRSIRRMGAATTKIVLERLKEEWLEVSDASVYRELELEKQLWMLSALQHLRKNSVDLTDHIKSIPPEEPNASTKMLSLYENHASASFLSALNPIPRIHHISTAPLSPASYPNIHPSGMPKPIPHLPYASNLFTSIHAFSLPAVLPASSIPKMLRECHRTLCSSTIPLKQHPILLHTPSPSSPISFSSSSTRTVIPPKRKAIQKAGTIHLSILDPAPLPNTLGPKLREWLDTHLLLNLERQFRCVNPARLFPLWLTDAGLRAEGSTIVTVPFLACVKERGEEEVEDQDEELGMKRELRSVVGRMLWKEMWGAFVEGEKWWWEDEKIVEECGVLGTTWEYAVIKGVRED